MRIYEARLSEVVRSGIECGTDSHAEPPAFFSRFGLFALPIVPADKLLSERQHSRVVAGVVDATVRRRVRHLTFANVVAQTHVVAGYSELVAADVKNALEEPEMLHSRIAAIRPDRTL